MTGPLYFEDVTVGQVFTTATHTITAERIMSFGAEFDPQPQHLNAASAARSPFGELVASGFHTASATLNLMIVAGGPNWVGALGIGLDELRWPRPVRPGDVLRVRIEVIELRESKSRPDRGVVRLRGETLNQHDEVVMSVLHTILILRRPAA